MHAAYTLQYQNETCTSVWSTQARLMMTVLKISSVDKVTKEETLRLFGGRVFGHADKRNDLIGHVFRAQTSSASNCERLYGKEEP